MVLRVHKTALTLSSEPLQAARSSDTLASIGSGDRYAPPSSDVLLAKDPPLHAPYQGEPNRLLTQGTKGPMANDRIVAELSPIEKGDFAEVKRRIQAYIFSWLEALPENYGNFATSADPESARIFVRSCIEFGFSLNFYRIAYWIFQAEGGRRGISEIVALMRRQQGIVLNGQKLALTALPPKIDAATAFSAYLAGYDALQGTTEIDELFRFYDPYYNALSALLRGEGSETAPTVARQYGNYIAANRLPGGKLSPQALVALVIDLGLLVGAGSDFVSIAMNSMAATQRGQGGRERVSEFMALIAPYASTAQLACFQRYVTDLERVGNRTRVAALTEQFMLDLAPLAVLHDMEVFVASPPQGAPAALETRVHGYIAAWWRQAQGVVRSEIIHPREKEEGAIQFYTALWKAGYPLDLNPIVEWVQAAYPGAGSHEELVKGLKEGFVPLGAGQFLSIPSLLAHYAVGQAESLRDPWFLPIDYHERELSVVIQSGAYRDLAELPAALSFFKDRLAMYRDERGHYHLPVTVMVELAVDFSRLCMTDETWTLELNSLLRILAPFAVKNVAIAEWAQGEGRDFLQVWFDRILAYSAPVERHVLQFLWHLFMNERPSNDDLRSYFESLIENIGRGSLDVTFPFSWLLEQMEPGIQASSLTEFQGALFQVCRTAFRVDSTLPTRFPGFYALLVAYGDPALQARLARLSPAQRDQVMVATIGSYLTESPLLLDVQLEDFARQEMMSRAESDAMARDLREIGERVRELRAREQRTRKQLEREQ